MNRYTCYLLFGSPGAGKGTQGKVVVNAWIGRVLETNHEPEEVNAKNKRDQRAWYTPFSEPVTFATSLSGKGRRKGLEPGLFVPRWLCDN
jgi:predicted ATPase